MSESGTGDHEGRIARLEQQDERLTQALDLLMQRDAVPPVKAGRDWDAYAAVIASFIGLLALGVSGYTAYVQRQQLRAQVWPHLELMYNTANPVLYASNQGTGPARVIAMRVTVNGVLVRTWSDVSKRAGFTGEVLFLWGISGMRSSPLARTCPSSNRETTSRVVQNSWNCSLAASTPCP